MAYSHIPTFVAKGAFTSGTAGITVAVPAGIRNNDLLMLFCESANQAITAPAGWTEVGTQASQATGTAAAAGGVRLAVFWKIASGVEASVAVADSGDHNTGIMMAFRGVDPANPFGSATPVSRIDSTATTAMTWATLTTTTANNLIVMATALDADAASTTTVGTVTAAGLTSITEQHDQTVIDGAGGGIHVATGIRAAAGAIGTMAATGSTSTTHGYLTMALQGRSDGITIPRGQYKADLDTVLPVGGSVYPYTEGMWAQLDVSPAYELNQSVSAKVEFKDTATSFTGTATATNATSTADSSDATYSARGGSLEYDSLNDQYIFWGGFDGTTRYANIWVRSGSDPGEPWRKQTTTGTPPTAANLAASAYYVSNGVGNFVIWGGNTGASDSNQMLVLNTTTWAWRTITQTSPPTARSYITKHMVAVPNGANADIYLFGGWAALRENQLVKMAGLSNTSTTGTWTTLKATGTAGNPSIRSGALMVYKASTSKIYIYGGYNGTTYLNDFWSYDIAGNAFTQISPTGTAPTGTELMAGGFDVTNNRVWYTGGWSDGTQVNGKNNVGYISGVGGGSEAYVEVRAPDTDNQMYAGHSSSASTVDTKRGWIILHEMMTKDSTERYSYAIDMNDGITSNKPVYGLNESDWMSSRDAPASVWDPVRREWLIINGFANMGDDTTISTGTHVNDIWSYDNFNNRWRYANKGNLGMPHTEGSVAVYDTTRNRVVVFGGLSGTAETGNEVWTATADANGMYKWAKLTPTSTPPTSRWLTTAVYDAANDRVLVVQGGKIGGPTNEVWELSFSSSAQGVWTQRTPTGSITGVTGAGFAVKASNTRLYIFAGATNQALTTVSSQLAYLDYSTTNGAYTSPTATGGTAVRTPSFGYDAINDRLIVQGGFNGTNSVTTVAFFQLSGTTWAASAPALLPDARRSAGAMFIDDQLYITHGRSDSSPWYRDTWALTPNYSTPASSVWTNKFPRMFVPEYIQYDPNIANNYHWQAWMTEEAVDQTKAAYPSLALKNYYFNASLSGPSDPNAIWTNDANAFDGSVTTFASIPTGANAGSTSSKYLGGGGTNAPSTGTDPISQVRVRYWALSGGDPTSVNVATAGQAENLGTTPAASGTGAYGSYATLTAPAAGWSWSALNALEARMFKTSNTASSNPGISRVELEVTIGNTDTVTAATDFTLSVGNPPTVVLDSPANAGTTADTTPDLLFTGTDAEGDTIEYEIQIDTVNTFDSQTGSPTTVNLTTTGAGTWTVPDGVTSVTVSVWGGGAAAGNIAASDANGSAGGGGGAFSQKVITVTPGSVINFSLGAGGVGTTVGAPTTGASGGDTWFNTATDTMAKGGTGGLGASGGLGGLAASGFGTTKFSGGGGGGGFRSGGGGSGGKTSDGGNGGLPSSSPGGTAGTGSPGGGVGAAGRGTGSGAGNNAAARGGGGGGSGSAAASPVAGANGFRGEIQLDYTPNVPLTDKLSASDAGFTAGHPFASGTQVTYTVQSALTSGSTYYWRVRGKDPTGTNTFGAWATTRSFTVSTGPATLTKTHTTDALKRKQSTLSHTTDSLKRKQNTLTHTTDANKKKTNTLTHTTDANKKKSGLTKFHTTDANKRVSGLTRSHTTDALKRKQSTVTHTTDSFKRTQNTRTHTTDAFRRIQTTKFHTTDANKKKGGITKFHTTDANKRVAGLTRTHTTDALKRKQLTLTHTTDSLKRSQTTKSHTTDALKRAQTTKTHTTDANKKRATLVSHTTDANKKKTLTVLHTTSANKRVTGLTRTHTTDALKRVSGLTRTHTTDALKRSQTTKTHTTDSLKRTQTTKFHTTDANKKKTNTRTHTTDANKRTTGVTRSHTTDALLRRQITKTHSTDALKRTQNTKVHTTDAFKRTQNTRSHTTDSLKRKQLTLVHSTDANKKKAGLTVSHTTDTQLRTGFVKSHSTDALLRKQNTRSHTTDSLKRKQNVVTHTTDSFLRRQNTKFHTTDANKRKALTVSHTTDANKKKTFTVSHTTSANKRVANITRAHTTDALKRSQNVRTHSTDALKRTQNTRSHTTDALKRRQLVLTHTTDANKKKTLTVSHTTSANLKKSGLVRSHTTDALKRKTNTVSHTTDALKRTANVRTHTTDANRRKTNTVSHTTDAFIDSGKRYWVGGTAAWDGTAGTKWAASSGGTGGFSVPTAANAVFFDGNSGSGTVTIQTVVAVGSSFNATGFTGTLVQNTNMNIGSATAGDFILGSGMTFTWVAGAIKLTSTKVSDTSVDLAGKTVGNFTFNGVGANFVLASDINASGALAFSGGGVDMNGYDAVADHLSNGNTTTRNTNMRGGTITLNGTGALFDTPAGTLTFSWTTGAKFILSDTSATTKTFAGGTLVLPPIEVLGAPSDGALTFSGAFTTDLLRLNPDTNIKFTAGTTLTATALDWHGTSGHLITIQSTSSGSPATISVASGTVLADYLSLKDNTATGGAAFYAGNNSVDNTGNTGWFFSSPATTFTVAHSTDALKRKQNTASHTTDSNKKRVTTVSHTTDANKKKSAITRTHTTDAFLRRQRTVSQTTDALKRSQTTRSHTTDANKKRTNIVSHTTDANKKKSGLTKFHTTDANLKKSGLTRTHTTDALKRKQFTLTHTTDTLKRSQTTRTHTTDANKRKSALVRTHTTDALKRTQTVKTHTTDANKRRATTVSHTTDALKRKQFTLAHSTDTLKRKQTTVTHSTDANKRRATLVSHTTDANKRKTGLTVSHTTDANKRKSGLTRTHTTDAFLRRQITKAHTTDANKRKTTVVSHTTDAFLRGANQRTHTTDANKKRAYTVVHSTSANKRKSGLLVSHTTDSNKRLSGLTRTHTTDALKRKQNVVSHTTDSNKRKTNTLSHTTDALKRVSGITRTHSTDALLRKQNVRTHTTDANKKRAYVVSHTTDANKRKAGLTKFHTTDANKRTAGLLKTHTTDALKRKTNTITHSTDALKRKQLILTHTTDSLKRTRNTRSHTTDANKRLSGNLRTHTTDANKRKTGIILTHTTDALKRKQLVLSHTTDSNKRKTNTKFHTTDGLKLAGRAVVHTTDANKRKATTVFHKTDANKRVAGFTKFHTTDTLKHTSSSVSHTTDTILHDTRYYTRTSNPTLPTDSGPLATGFSMADYGTVSADDSTYVCQPGYKYLLFNFERYSPSNLYEIHITWNGKSSIWTQTRPVYLQIFNNVSGLWETLDMNNNTLENTDFTLTGNILSGMAPYYDANTKIVARVYQ